MKLCVALLGTALVCFPQDFTQRGFLETRFVLYPQEARDDAAHIVAESLSRYEAAYRLTPQLRVNGSFDARSDTHRQTERRWHVAWGDRGIQRPAFGVRRLSATYNRGGLTVEVGKQFIRWGKTDILIPTDRFAPRDYLGVVDNEFLGVTAARITYEHRSDTVDLVWSPRFTPSRIPLLNQRWVVLPDVPPGFRIEDAGARYPGGGQYGVRWNHIGAGFEGSLSFYEGYNHLPLLEGRPIPAGLEFQRLYPQMRMYGGDFAKPLPWLTLKGEVAYFTSRTPLADEYVLYLIQLERQAGEWFFVGGYAGEAVTESRSNIDFSPDRGLARAFVGRAGYTIDTNRSIAFETALRQNGKGIWSRLEYSHAFGQHWRATAGFTLIRGSESDFLGQYRRNSHGTLTFRYSF